MSGGFALIEGDVTLYDSAGVELAVENATALPANTRGFVSVGYDGANTRFVLVDSSGRQIIVGAGTAGSPSGGVVSIQGVASGTAVPVSDGGGSLTIDTSQLPTVLLGGRLDTNIGAWFGSTVPTVGQKPMVSSIPVAIAADQSVIPVSQNGPPWKVEGTDADGAAPTENPVLVAGQDGTNVQTLKTNTYGRLEHVLYDGANHPIGVILDGAIYRLQVEARIARPSSSAVVIDFLKNGGSEDMVVDGDPTPVVFSFPADATDRIYLTRLRIVMSAASFSFDGTKFAKGSALTNGVLLEAVIDDGISVSLANVQINEDFARLTDFTTEFNAVLGDLLVSDLEFSANEYLEAGSSDLVKITIRDDFTNAGLYGVNYLTATLYGYKEQ